MHEHHFNFLDQEDVRKRLGLIEQTLKEKTLSTVKCHPAPLVGTIEVKKKNYKAGPCPEWARPENSKVIWDKFRECSLGEAAIKFRVDLRATPRAYYQPTLVDHWSLHESGYITRHNEGTSEIRKLNERVDP